MICNDLKFTHTHWYVIAYNVRNIYFIFFSPVNRYSLWNTTIQISSFNNSLSLMVNNINKQYPLINVCVYDGGIHCPSLNYVKKIFFFVKVLKCKKKTFWKLVEKVAWFFSFWWFYFREPNIGHWAMHLGLPLLGNCFIKKSQLKISVLMRIIKVLSLWKVGPNKGAFIKIKKRAYDYLMNKGWY